MILITNTWTGKESVFPVPFPEKSHAEDKLKELEGKCSFTKSETKAIKNNQFTILAS